MSEIIFLECIRKTNFNYLRKSDFLVEDNFVDKTDYIINVTTNK